MSRDRARARAQRDREAAAARLAAERRRTRRHRWERLRPPMPKGRFLAPRTQRRPARRGLPGHVRGLLGVGWLAAQGLAWSLTSVPAQRLGVAVLTLALLPLVVVLLVPASVRRSAR